MPDLALPPHALASSSTALLFASGSSVHYLSTSHPQDVQTAPAGPATQLHPASHPSKRALALIRNLAISEDSKFGATISEDKGLRVYSLPDPSEEASSTAFELLSTRFLTKKASYLSFTAQNDLLVSDKVGDVYLYPLHPATEPVADGNNGTDRLATFVVQADPTLNPDAKYILGHVSVNTAHLLTPDGKRIITADRDEHIRISRYPQSFVIERFLWGTEGFVSALHIPKSRTHSGILISGGGESCLRLWDWARGEPLGKVEFGDGVRAQRRVRTGMRKIKEKTRGRFREPAGNGNTASSAAGAGVGVEQGDGTASKTGEEKREKPFYATEQGWQLPSGEGILVKKIETLQVDGQTIVLFFSEGAAAIHSFVLDSANIASTTSATTLPLPFPILDFASIPGEPNRILLSLDTAWGVLKRNQVGGQYPDAIKVDLTEESQASLRDTLMVVELDAQGQFTTTSSELLGTMKALLDSSDNQVQQATLSSMQLYPNLSLYPRWAGLEEDDELAGPAPGDGEGEGEAPPQPQAVGGKKEYTIEELESMHPKHLGRLRAQGYDIDALLKKRKGEVAAAREEEKKRRKLEGKGRGSSSKGKSNPATATTAKGPVEEEDGNA